MGDGMRSRYVLLVVGCMVLSACAATRSSSTTTEPGAKQESTLDLPKEVTSNRPETDPAKIILTKDDITDRKYEVIGDIKATVSKTTIFQFGPDTGTGRRRAA